ncbi:hypothetical protein NG895_28865 [Aeoliella sp. ICT_H6.2]|uniref:SRPBCC domain-containing protein n=1 Tax=Aeoliella straminimaris TaxID=2954799 RepID=A0A9X2JJI7_9BACT|nr:hypothetical protein [Aeoliella straminimaris]MCO6047936.1 hypothetical protein [Aeoliella straminimaris]
MAAVRITEGRVARYELEIAIKASSESVWKAIVEQTNSWWLPDFHMLGPESMVSLQARAGGSLLEQTEDQGSLLWATVQMCLPEQFTLYLLLHTAPDWGGPTTSSMKIALEPVDQTSCVLKLADALVGHISEQNVQELRRGWESLFAGGLKQFVEANSN